MDPSAQGLLEGMGLDGDTLAPMETDEPAAADPKAKSKLTPAMATRIKQIKPLLSGEGDPLGDTGHRLSRWTHFRSFDSLVLVWFYFKFSLPGQVFDRFEDIEDRSKRPCLTLLPLFVPFFFLSSSRPLSRSLHPASSRLGRALAELFGLLVKLCVGSPVRQRRSHHATSTGTAPTPAARATASSLTKLLTKGLSWQPPPYTPTPRFRYGRSRNRPARFSCVLSG